MGRRGRFATTVGLVLLVLVDIALVFAALRISTRSGAAEPSTANTAAPNSTQAATAAPTSGSESATQAPPPPPASTSAPAAAPAVPLQVLLTAVDGTSAWRAKAGSCGSGGAAISLTGDGGGTWRPRTTPFPVLSRLLPADATKATAVGATAACEMAAKGSTDGGGTWPVTGNLSEILARDPKDPAKVRVPGGKSATPCDGSPVVDLARNSANGAQALCADGGIRTTTDDGSQWPKTSDQPGALALDSKLVGNAVTTYVASTKSGCEGVTVSSVVGDKVTDLGCVGTEAPAPGSVAISVPTAEAGWLLIGDTSWRASNGLKTWTRTGG